MTWQENFGHFFLYIFRYLIKPILWMKEKKTMSMIYCNREKESNIYKPFHFVNLLLCACHIKCKHIKALIWGYYIDFAYIKYKLEAVCRSGSDGMEESRYVFYWICTVSWLYCCTYVCIKHLVKLYILKWANVTITSSPS